MRSEANCMVLTRHRRMKSSRYGSLYISLFASSYNLTVIITHLSHMLNIQHFSIDWGGTQCSLESFTTLLWFGKGSASHKHARDYYCAATLSHTTLQSYTNTCTLHIQDASLLGQGFAQKITWTLDYLLFYIMHSFPCLLTADGEMS